MIQNSKRNKLGQGNINNDNLELLQFSIPNTKLSELVVEDDLRNRIKRIIKENKQKESLLSYGLQSRRKILIEGPSGTGKTMTSKIIATELNYPLYTIQMDKLVTKYMGETSIKLRQIFDVIAENEGVYLFDEFDAIASERSLENDVGEMRRVLNSFLQFIEQDTSNSIIIAITNNPKLLDKALFRRFDDIIHYNIPNEYQIKTLMENKLANFVNEDIITSGLIEKATNLSHAEISRVCEDTIKISVLNKRKIEIKLLEEMIKERKSAYFSGGNDC
ncbi:MAG: ATP-binding protein [Bacilli bacterium]|nr:ATP-binding protein [Bacilli bacterium]